ncbi:hypothetical protein [Aestuariivirga sp.]|uniref:hypothetical protein n=1 Tax=Aestuariivirga sp. TaxID=2650926 RepID=UPI003592FEA6
MEYPRFVDRLPASNAFKVHPRTLTNTMDRPYDRTTERLPLMQMCKAAQCEPAWFMACLRGEDRAVTLSEAAMALGLTERQMLHKTSLRPTAKPSAVLCRSRRYSARDLGLYRETPVMPPVGHPAHPSCGE